MNLHNMSSMELCIQLIPQANLTINGLIINIRKIYRHQNIAKALMSLSLIYFD